MRKVLIVKVGTDHCYKAAKTERESNKDADKYVRKLKKTFKSSFTDEELGKLNLLFLQEPGHSNIYFELLPLE